MWANDQAPVHQNMARARSVMQRIISNLRKGRQSCSWRLDDAKGDRTIDELLAPGDAIRTRMRLSRSTLLAGSDRFLGVATALPKGLTVQ